MVLIVLIVVWNFEKKSIAQQAIYPRTREISSGFPYVFLAGCIAFKKTPYVVDHLRTHFSPFA